jgi:hypothetical protein
MKSTLKELKVEENRLKNNIDELGKYVETKVLVDK